MIPWRMMFSGIRDYRPEKIDLSGVDTHMIITGPNGSGKSTITYCMGAVLGSSKVDIEGLKSRNLLPDQTWKAQISLLFKNDGQMKIDAPTFIQFTLKIVQEPGQPVKKEYTISSGEVLDEWEDTIRYTSGERHLNITAYKKDLQYKYKVDPDVYYLIWYQQEVNQFAVMNPEERFRIFSEMHGIDQTQRAWEESIEKLKDTKETLKTAELNLKSKNFELGLKKKDLDRYLDNQERLKAGAKQYIESLLQLETILKKEIEDIDELTLQLDEGLDVTRETISMKIEQIGEMETKMTLVKNAQAQLDLDYEEKKKKLEGLNHDIGEVRKQIGRLEEELEDIDKRKNLISRTEEQVKIQLEMNRKEKEEHTRYQNELEGSLLNFEKTQRQLDKSIAELNYSIEQDEKIYKTHIERLQEYKSSHAVEATITQLNQQIKKDKDVEWKLSSDMEVLKSELLLLEEDKDLSQRQQESLKFLSARNMKAFPLNELIELDDNAQLKDENLFDAIKYTIFFQGKHVEAPNDLYHVPLMGIVPEHMVDHLPKQHLKVKDSVNDEEFPLALKALWWVGQFFKSDTFHIEKGILQDEMGFRGQQEKERFILSPKALLARKQEVEESIRKHDERLKELKQQINENTRISQNLHSIIQLVKESEAFMTKDYERISRKNKRDAEMAQLSDIEVSMIQTREAITELMMNIAEQKVEEKALKEEEEFYQEIGALKDKYEALQVSRAQEKALKKKIVEEKNNLHELDDRFDKSERAMKDLERKKNQIKNKQEDLEREVDRQSIQKRNAEDDRITKTQQLVGYIQELTDIQGLEPVRYKEASEKRFPIVLPRTGNLLQQREEGQVIFNQARGETDIDAAAPENYEAVKVEYERLDDEYKRTNLLLEQDIERADQLKDKLETTINMRVLEIQQRFKSYMSHFQFEGEISWESYEDRRGRTHFKLFIKARKEGHRGTMEDVSTKARGGKVGKGVSGGEESLSSLLFALALLQNLYFKPGFIVLDEFDSALDENRKYKVFDLYVKELKRKLIILTPKSHEQNYLSRFSKALVIKHDPTIPLSKVIGIAKKEATHSIKQ